jgi:hypothetical protein
MRMSRKSKSLSTRKGNTPESSKGQGAERNLYFCNGCGMLMVAAQPLRRRASGPWEVQIGKDS